MVKTIDDNIDKFNCQIDIHLNLTKELSIEKYFQLTDLNSYPYLLNLISQLCQEYQITYIRLPNESLFFYKEIIE